jgi:glycosyltransferase involved in cell wall biosynthesis
MLSNALPTGRCLSLISIVIATRNRRSLLSEAIASVVEQSYPNWELIVVDDASSDDTGAYLASLANSRIRVLRQDRHQERSSARNRGLAEAQGEFIMFLDDDDVLRPTALKVLWNSLNPHPEAVAALGPCRILQTNGDSVKVYWPSKSHSRTIWRELLFGFWANSGQNLYRTDVIRELGGFDAAAEPCEDRKLWLRVARRGPVFLAPTVVMEYRMHAGQSKPGNLGEIRRRVWSDFIAKLPEPDRQQALRTRASSEFVELAKEKRRKRQFAEALLLQARACLTSPWLLTSPLTARPLWWELKKCLMRSVGH